MAADKPRCHAGNGCSSKECESSVTMNVRCRRGCLLVFLPMLVIMCLVTNVTIIINHNHDENGSGDSSEEPSGDGIGDDFVPFNHTTQARGAMPAGAGPVLLGVPAPRRSARNRQQVASRRRRPGGVTWPSPKAAVLSEETTFSACLLIKDDNEILPEWLAYHYHAIKLRQLIVAVDPLSSQSPSEILKKWHTHTDLNIVEWTDKDYMPEYFLERGRPPRKYMQNYTGLDDNSILEISIHRYRQRVFLTRCMRTFRDMKQSWVIHIDTDEYVVASKLVRQMKPRYLDLQPMETPGSILDLLQQTVRKTTAMVNYPCIGMLRVLFGASESSDADVNARVPDGYNARRFETLRWHYHARPHNDTLRGSPKVILDVSAIPEKYFPDEIVFSIHRPISQFCPRKSDMYFGNYRKQPIAVNHYVGSWERYNARSDKRRNRDVYDVKARVREGHDDDIRPWLMGFVNTLGTENAAFLLGEDYVATTTPPPLNSNDTVKTQTRCAMDNSSMCIM